MAKTYTAAGSAVAGDVYTAAAHNVIVTDVNNFIVPASVGVYNTGNVSCANGAYTRLSFTTSSWDTDSMKGAGTVTGLTINTTGLYLITAYVLFDASANALRGLLIDKGTSSSLTSTIASINATIPGNGNYADANVTGVASLNAGDTIQLFAFQYGAGGPAINVLGASNRLFTATWIGRTS